jgi:hypothetical protein
VTGPVERGVDPLGPDDAGASEGHLDVETVLATSLPTEIVPDQLTPPRWVAPLAAICAIGLVPWIVYLALALPSHARSAHYDIAWVGFDIGMLLALVSLAYCALRRSPLTELAASVTATLLVSDAWFDVVTTSKSDEMVFSILSAVFIELPLAALCVWVAVNAERLRRRAYRRLWQRAEYATAVATRLAAGQRRARRMR